MHRPLPPPRGKDLLSFQMKFPPTSAGPTSSTLDFAFTFLHHARPFLPAINLLRRRLPRRGASLGVHLFRPKNRIPSSSFFLPYFAATAVLLIRVRARARATHHRFMVLQVAHNLAYYTWSRDKYKCARNSLAFGRESVWL